MCDEIVEAIMKSKELQERLKTTSLTAGGYIECKPEQRASDKPKAALPANRLDIKFADYPAVIDYMRTLYQ